MAATTRKLNDAIRKAVLARYAAGEKGKDIAADYDLPETTVFSIASRAGLTGSRNREESPKVLTEDMGSWVYTDGVGRWVPADATARGGAA